MVQSKKFRGVRQRHWGSWVSEIRHPLLKRRVWLGTFETAEEAARVYDEAAVLMSGRNAKTNFPVPRNPAGDVQLQGRCQGGGSHHVSPTGLSEILSAKLRKCCKTPSPSLTCLRLDTDKSHLGVWQKRAGARADSSWVMRVELAMSSQPAVPPSSAGEGTSSTTSTSQKASGGTEEEEMLALQMIEELLSRNCGPASSPCRAGTAPDGDGCSSSSSTSGSSSI